MLTYFILYLRDVGLYKQYKCTEWRNK